ncbi:MAG TPA: HAMP domain-containing sensor histidine kinase, partial [Solirubrobacteraceae bacterium]
MLVLAVVSLGVPLALSLRDRVNAEVHSQALNQADVVAATAADMISPVNSGGLDALVRSSAASVRGRVIIVDHRGLVLADSDGSSTLGSSYLSVSRPEIAAALHGHAIQSQRVSRSLGQDILATAVPVLRRASVVGAVRITQSVAAVHNAVSSTVTKLILVAGTVLLLGLLAGSVIARQIARPLGRLEGTAKRLAGGDLSARASVEGSSEQRSLSTSFNEMADRVERLVTAQREFIADASHQLRTPLTGLRLRLEEARAGGVGRDVAAELDAGTSEVDRLAAIVDELLVLSRAEDRELHGEQIELATVVAAAAERWQAAASARGIDLASGADGGHAWCARADVDRALDVLVENALHYSPPGGRVSISCVPGRIEVADSGPGLAPGEEDLVFERFHRGSAGRRGPAGSGLGLAIARTLARAWHG